MLRVLGLPPRPPPPNIVPVTAGLFAPACDLAVCLSRAVSWMRLTPATTPCFCRSRILAGTARAGPRKIGSFKILAFLALRRQFEEDHLDVHRRGGSVDMAQHCGRLLDDGRR